MQRSWITKAHNRPPIDNEIFKRLYDDLNTISVKINNYIRSMGAKE